MTTPTFAPPTRLGRFYRFPAILDEDFPSVTTVIKQLNAPQLTSYKERQVALAAIRDTDWRDYDEETATEMLLASAKAHSRGRANVGTTVHQLIENGEDTVDDDHRPYLLAAAHILTTLGDHYQSELTVVNRTAGYAGTADVYTWRPDQPSELAVTDWKTTKPDGTVGWRNHQLQLAALAACSEYVDPKGVIHPLPAPVTQLNVVGLRADGTYDIRTLTNKDRIASLQRAFNGLLSCLELDNEWPWLTIWDEAKENQTP